MNLFATHVTTPLATAKQQLLTLFVRQHHYHELLLGLKKNLKNHMVMQLSDSEKKVVT